MSTFANKFSFDCAILNIYLFTLVTMEKDLTVDILPPFAEMNR